jgi:hypothetical protein
VKLRVEAYFRPVHVDEPRRLAAAGAEVERELMQLEAVAFDAPSMHVFLVGEGMEHARGRLRIGSFDAEPIVNDSRPVRQWLGCGLAHLVSFDSSRVVSID